VSEKKLSFLEIAKLEKKCCDFHWLTKMLSLWC